MVLGRQSSRRLRHVRQLKSKQGSAVVLLVVLMTLSLTVATIRKAMAHSRPLPSEMRARVQAQKALQKKSQSQFVHHILYASMCQSMYLSMHQL